MFEDTSSFQLFIISIHDSPIVHFHNNYIKILTKQNKNVCQKIIFKKKTITFLINVKPNYRVSNKEVEVENVRQTEPANLLRQRVSRLIMIDAPNETDKAKVHVHFRVEGVVLQAPKNTFIGPIR